MVDPGVFLGSHPAVQGPQALGMFLALGEVGELLGYLSFTPAWGGSGVGQAPSGCSCGRRAGCDLEDLVLQHRPAGH